MGDSLAIVRGNTSKMQGVIILATMSLLTASTPRIFTLYCNTLQHFFTLLLKSVSVAGAPAPQKTKNSFTAFLVFP